MNELDNIESIKDKNKKKEKLIEYYNNDIKIDTWLINDTKVSIINFKDRTEYKKFNKYHRLNGPAVDYNDESLDKYYYKGNLYETKEEWEKITIKDLRKIKMKRLKQVNG